MELGTTDEDYACDHAKIRNLKIFMCSQYIAVPFSLAYYSAKLIVKSEWDKDDYAYSSNLQPSLILTKNNEIDSIIWLVDRILDHTILTLTFYYIMWPKKIKGKMVVREGDHHRVSLYPSTQYSKQTGQTLSSNPNSLYSAGTAIMSLGSAVQG